MGLRKSLLTLAGISLTTLACVGAGYELGPSLSQDYYLRNDTGTKEYGDFISNCRKNSAIVGAVTGLVIIAALGGAEVQQKEIWGK
ncbi:hypothetical protein J4218_04560 [Candidatus Pacearchaeota archaeon]|nr:hypothetical protein [Candidatus Pacearchaeota archaeon]